MEFPRAHIILGCPGTGTSSAALGVANRTGAELLSYEALRRETLYDEEAIARVAARKAQMILTAGQSVVVEGSISGRHSLNTLIARLAGHPINLCTLRARWETVEQRNRSKPGKLIVPSEILLLAFQIGSQITAGRVIHTDNLSTQQVADAILGGP
jgi:predicted kinase